jgi:hypothetical protein
MLAGRNVAGSIPEDVTAFLIYLILVAELRSLGSILLQQKRLPGMFLGDKASPANSSGWNPHRHL